MRIKSEQFLKLKNTLISVPTKFDKDKAYNASTELNKYSTSPFYSHKILVKSKATNYATLKLYVFYFSSDFDLNFFKIKYAGQYYE